MTTFLKIMKFSMGTETYLPKLIMKINVVIVSVDSHHIVCRMKCPPLFNQGHEWKP